MNLTAQLGTPNSAPGNLALGSLAPRHVRVHAVRSVTGGGSYESAWGDLPAVEYYACLMLVILFISA